MRLDHVQLAMPAGREEEAEAFYSGLLGFERLPKPPALAAPGVAGSPAERWRCTWGWTEDFRPARKLTRPSWSTTWPRWRRRYEAGVEVRPNADRRPGTGAYADDPFGNRLEFMAAPSVGQTVPD